MNPFRSILYFLVGVLLSSIAVLAFAECKKPAQTVYVGSYNGNSYSAPTAAQYCSVISAASGVSLQPDGNSVCYGTQNNGSSFYVNMAQTYACPDGTSPDVNHMCKCVECNPLKDQYYNGGQPGLKSKSGSDMTFEGSTSNASAPSAFCDQNTQCMLSTDNLETVASGNYWGGTGNPQFNGLPCSNFNGSGMPQQDHSEKQNPNDEYSCIKSGQGFGYVNGQVVCTKADSSKSPGGTASSEKTNADGSKTKTDVKQEVSCDGTTCTTTTTTTTTETSSTGTSTTSTKTDTSTKPDPSNGSGTGSNGQKGDTSFCQNNPNSPACQSSSFSGACGTAPTCTGDAVNCAIAKATFLSNCAITPSEDALKAGQDSLTQKQAGSGAEDDPAKRTEITVEIQPNEVGGVCPNNETFVLMGQSIDIPFSDLCDGFGWMRAALLIVAGMISMYIVIEGVK